ncbi:MAG: hypothetical protein AB7E55_07200 [Pigmentiphaga sp.]
MSRYFSVLLLLLACLNGCVQDYSLAAPDNSEQVTIRVKVPSDLKARTMQAMYRSTSCQRTRYDAYGKPYKVDGFHGIDVQLQQQGQSDIYEARLARDGGGACRWHLSNITFGVALRNPEQFGNGVTFGGGGGVVVILDHNDSSMGGADIRIDGDVVVKEELYPWLSESFLGGYKRQVYLSGQSQTFLKYQALNARSLYFEPRFNPRLIVYSTEPKVHRVGVFTKFSYPDGSVVSDGGAYPDFRRLEAIRKAIENNK